MEAWYVVVQAICDLIATKMYMISQFDIMAVDTQKLAQTAQIIVDTYRMASPVFRSLIGVIKIIF